MGGIPKRVLLHKFYPRPPKSPPTHPWHFTTFWKITCRMQGLFATGETWIWLNVESLQLWWLTSSPLCSNVSVWLNVATRTAATVRQLKASNCCDSPVRLFSTVFKCFRLTHGHCVTTIATYLIFYKIFDSTVKASETAMTHSLSWVTTKVWLYNCDLNYSQL